MSKNLTLSTQGLRKGSTLSALLGADETPSTTPNNVPNTPSTQPAAEAAEGGRAAQREAGQAESGAEAAAKPKSRRHEPVQTTPAQTDDYVFWAVGILEQTSIAVDPELLTAVEALRQELSVPAATLFSAVVHAGLPVDGEAAADAVLTEQAEHPGRGREYNLRMPVGLKARLDELLKQTTALIGHANRADLVNMALRAGLPADVDQARALFIAYQRQQTLARRFKVPTREPKEPTAVMLADLRGDR